MAKLVYEEIIRMQRSKSPEWWAQGVTVAFEQYIGRRQPGQTCDGSFSVTVSKTVAGDMDAGLTAWLARVKGVTIYNEVKLTSVPRTSQTQKWRYWRADLADGSKLSVNIQSKPDGKKSLLAINHDKLVSADDVEHWRAFWKAFDVR